MERGTLCEANRAKASYHNVRGATQELLQTIRNDPNMEWLSGLCLKLDQTLNTIREGQSEFGRDFLVQDIKDARLKWGDDATSTYCKEWLSAFEPKLKELIASRNSLLSNVRAG